MNHNPKQSDLIGIEDLKAFRERTKWKDNPLTSIHVPDDQNLKIRSDGFLNPFLGDTVLFDLPAGCRKALGALRDVLYEKHEKLFCIPLPDDSLHITLHDLTAGKPDELEAISKAMEAHRPEVEKHLKAFRVQYSRPIRLRPTKLVNMVGRSVVLLFEPETDADCKALSAMYSQLNDVVQLSYKLTPHVTLAYYKPQPISDADARRLGQSCSDLLKAHPLETLSLETGNLHYRCFTSMARYLSYDQFIHQLSCTPEELHARVEFDNLYAYARHRLKQVYHEDVLRELEGFGLGLSTAMSQRRAAASVNSMIATYPFDADDRYAFTPSCTGGVGGKFDHQFLCAVIITNLYNRGLLDNAADLCGEENLIRHCMIDLRWQQ